jgi:vacuolar-type H+-ATPase subunit F/Vma7
VKVVAIGSRTMAIAMKLAGVAQAVEVHDGREIDAAKVRAAFRSFLLDEEVGLIIITQTCADAIRSDIDRLKAEKRVTPAILEIPDEAGPGVDRIQRIIKRAVGIEVKR